VPDEPASRLIPRTASRQISNQDSLGRVLERGVEMMRLKMTVATGLGAAAAVVCGAALATTPGTNGQIAFRRYFNDEQTKSAIFTMNADGSGIRRVTHAPRRTHDDQPDSSPDGKRLVFTRIPANGPNYVEVVNADGSGLQRVTPRCTKKPPPDRVPSGCEDAGEPSFAPDGQQVTYVRATGRIRRFKKFDYEQIQHAAVAIIGVDGGGEREILRLPPYSADVHYPQVSPDGRLIVFERANSPLSRPRFAGSRRGSCTAATTPTGRRTAHASCSARTRRSTTNARSTTRCVPTGPA
jgi:WD40-like Beta Propeller Repeat